MMQTRQTQNLLPLWRAGASPAIGIDHVQMLVWVLECGDSVCIWFWVSSLMERHRCSKPFLCRFESCLTHMDQWCNGSIILLQSVGAGASPVPRMGSYRLTVRSDDFQLSSTSSTLVRSILRSGAVEAY